jgi:hypothetical protein
MKIPSGHYHEINKIRDEILTEAEDELKNKLIMKLFLTGI